MVTLGKWDTLGHSRLVFQGKVWDIGPHVNKGVAVPLWKSSHKLDVLINQIYINDGGSSNFHVACLLFLWF